MASGKDLQTNGDLAGLHHPQLTGRPMGQVDHPVISKRTAVVDPHHDAAAVVEIDDPHPGSEGEGPMRCGEGALAQPLTTRGLATVKARAIPTGSTVDHPQQPRRRLWLLGGWGPLFVVNVLNSKLLSAGTAPGWSRSEQQDQGQEGHAKAMAGPIQATSASTARLPGI